jgi:frataxin-like iron-binding protein CyaY
MLEQHWFSGKVGKVLNMLTLIQHQANIGFREKLETMLNPHPTSGQHWFSGKVGNHVKPSSNIGQHWFSGKVGKVLNMLNQSIPSQFPEQVKMKTKMDHG